MTAPFERSAEIYDIIHAGKDYDREAVEIVRLLYPCRRLTPFDTRLIDIGCGTGEFTRRFEQLEFDSVGLDSSLSMVAVARDKGVRADVGTVHNPPFREQVEAVTCLFGAFSYMTCGNELQRTLQAIRGMLRRRGRFFFDVIHVAACCSSLRKQSEATFGPVHRKLIKSFDFERSIVNHEITYTYKGETWTEHHQMRAFSVPEITYALRDCGFTVLDCARGFDSPDDFGTAEINGSSYYFSVLAEAN